MLRFEITETMPELQRRHDKKNRLNLNKQSDKSFSFLSADEIEKLKLENEKKIATIARETKKKFVSSTASDNINNNDQFDINDNEDEYYHNKSFIINQHEVTDEDADDMR